MRIPETVGLQWYSCCLPSYLEEHKTSKNVNIHVRNTCWILVYRVLLLKMNYELVNLFLLERRWGLLDPSFRRVTVSSAADIEQTRKPQPPLAVCVCGVCMSWHRGHLWLTVLNYTLSSSAHQRLPPLHNLRVDVHL